MNNQLTLNFEAGLTSAYNTCRELVQGRVHQQGRQVKSIAADMDYSPSTLSRKLAQSPNDSQKLTLDDLESYLEITGDKQPVFYLVEKYLTNEKTQLEELEAEIARLKQQAKLNQ
jgi:hypothetical protein